MSDYRRTVITSATIPFSPFARPILSRYIYQLLSGVVYERTNNNSVSFYKTGIRYEKLSFFFCIRKETSQILAKIQLYLSFRTLSRKYLVTIVRAFEESTYINSKNYTDAVAFIYHSYKNIDGNEFDLPNLSYQRGEENPCEGKNPCEPTGGKKYSTRERLLEGR